MKTYGKQQVQRHIHISSIIDEVSGQIYAPSTLLRGGGWREARSKTPKIKN
jgi:hypothetical protein